MVSPTTASLPVSGGASVQLTATVTGVRGTVLSGQAIAWSTSDAAKATVSSGGLVSAVSPGAVTITASASGRSGTAVITVLPPTTYTIAVTPGSQTLSLGLATRLTAAVRDEGGQSVSGLPIAWSSSDSATASVDTSGVVSALQTGTVTISASVGGFRGQADLTVGAAPPIAACKLPVRTGSVAFGFPRSATRLRSTGTVRATVIFVDFSDVPATLSPQQILDILDPTAPRIFSALSYGAMQLVLEPNLRWLRMSKRSTEYGWPGVTFADHAAFLQEAATLAESSTDFSQTDALVVMTDPTAGGITNGPAFGPGSPTGGLRVAGRTSTINNATNSGRDLRRWGGAWLVHEMGHLLSLPDLYDLQPPSPFNQHRFVGDWSLMGRIDGAGAEWTAFERWQLGWLADAQMVCAPTGTSLVSLTPIERAGGIKAAVLPVTSTTAVIVESRRSLGYDAAIAQTGPLVYFIDTGIGSGRGSMRVLPIDDTDAFKLGRTLRVGESISHQGVTVTLESRRDNADVVRVIRP